MRSNHQTLTSILTGTLTFTYPTTSSWRGLFRRVVFVLLAFAWSAGAWAYSGTGTEGDPYVISGANANTNWTDLKTVMALGGYIRLDANCTDGTKNSTSYLEVPNGKTVTLNLNGKTINRGLTSAIDDGFVINNQGTLTINGNGTITGGKNTGNGGGICSSGSSSYLTINGGSITGNSASNGGGIYYSNGSLYINGGSITANSATSNGGGIYNRAYNMSVSGNCTIKDNLKGTNQNNVYLETSNSYIKITGNLASETRIGVTTGGAVPIKIVDNRKTTSPYDHKFDISTSNFTSDNTSNVVALTNDGYAYLSKKYIDDSPNDRTIVLEIPLHSGSEWTNVELMGKGTSANPYQIGSVKEWEAFATIVNADDGKLDACAILTADITFTGNHQQVGEDGNWSFANTPSQRHYRGTFDGRGHTITLKFGATGGKDNQSTWGGLFWHVTGATIKNLKVAGEITPGREECGTIVQHGSNYKIYNCESMVIINGRNQVGGLIGTHFGNGSSEIKNCYTHGQISPTSGSYTKAGGFIGRTATSTVSIQNSYAAPQVISNYSSYYTIYAHGNSSTITGLTDSYYKVPTYTGTITAQGTNAASLTATEICAGLNTNATGTPWVAHNDTVYLATFAKYVDIVGWTYGSPNTPTIVGNNGNGAVTYQYKVQGAADNTYATYTPGETVLGAGNYTLKASVAAVTDGNGEKWNAWESTMDFTVSKAQGTITAAPTAAAASPTYSGNAQALLATNGTATGTFHYRVGTSGDWSTTPPSETAAGNYSVYYYVTPDGNHNTIEGFGSAESPLGPIAVEIEKAPLTVTANNHSIIYGNPPAHNSASYDGFVNNETSAVLGGTLSFNIDYLQNGNVGSYPITPYGLTSNNYNITFVSGTLTVGKKDVIVSGITANDKFYDGNNIATFNTGNASFDGLVNGDVLTVSATGTFEDADAGSGKTVILGTLTLGGEKAGNYELAAVGQQTTTEAEIKKQQLIVKATDNDIFYGDAPIANGVFADGFVNGESLENLGGIIEYAYSYEQYGDVGNTYTITPSGLTSNNYDISYVDGTLTVRKKEVTVSGITASNKTYDGNTTATIDTEHASFSGLVNNDNLTVSTTGTFEDADAGTGKTVTLGTLTLGGTSVGNYQLAASGQQTATTATITKKDLTVTANDHNITYGDAPSGNGVEYSGFVNGETSAVLGGTLSYTYSYEQYGDVGNTYTIIPSGLTSSNYDISFVAGTLEVGQKEVGLTWSTLTTFTYDGKKHAPTATATGLVNSDEIGVTVTGAQTNANASAYTVTASALTGTKSGNYKLPTANTQTFTITPKAITADLLNAKISLSSISFEYTGEAQAPTVTITGMTEGTDYTVKYKKGSSEATSEKPKEADTYAIVIVGKGNYSGEVVTSKTFTIEEPLPEIVDSSKPVTVGGETFYELTSGIKESIGSTIQADIALPAVADTRTMVTSEGALSFSKGADIMMAVRNLKLSDIVTFIFTGNLYGDSSRLRQKGTAARGTRGDSALKLVSGVAYEVISAGDMIVSLKLGEEESTVKSINVKASATGINAVEAEKGEDLWFDLSGRRIDKPTKKGIYIKNGQKVVFDSAH